MDVVLTILGLVLLFAGIAGCIVPGLPGPPLNYAALLLLQFKSDAPFSLKFLVIWAIIVLLVTLADYAIPAIGARKFGASRKGAWGALFGAVLGIFIFPPWGIFIGAALGALAGEILAGKDAAQAFRSAMGTFAGFLAGTLLKLMASLAMSWYFIASLF